MMLAHRMLPSAVKMCTGPVSMPASMPILAMHVRLTSTSCSGQPHSALGGTHSVLGGTHGRAHSRTKHGSFSVHAKSKEEEAEVPWHLGFQMNERYLKWDDAAARQLIKLYLSQQLQISDEEVDARLMELGTLVPDMVGRLERTRGDILLSLIRDPPTTVRKLMGLRDLMPGVNISLLVSRWPYIVMDFTSEDVKARFDELRSKLPGVRVELLVDAEPMFLRADLDKVLANIKRIMPGHDPVAILLAQPQMVLDMNSAGMPSAEDVEGYSPRKSKP